jgi:hypothetical protein
VFTFGFGLLGVTLVRSATSHKLKQSKKNYNEWPNSQCSRAHMEQAFHAKAKNEKQSLLFENDQHKDSRTNYTLLFDQRGSYTTIYTGINRNFMIL